MTRRSAGWAARWWSSASVGLFDAARTFEKDSPNREIWPSELFGGRRFQRSRMGLRRGKSSKSSRAASGSICIIDRSALVATANFKAWISAMWLSAEKSVGWKTVLNGNALSGEGVDIVERQIGFNRQGAVTSAVLWRKGSRVSRCCSAARAYPA